MTPSREYGIAAPGYRLPDATSVGAVTLMTSALDRSTAYYREVLGLEAVDSGAESVALAAAGGAPLVVLKSRAGIRPVPRGGLLGLFHFAILVPSRGDLGRFVRHLDTRGVPFASADHLVSEAIYLWDPDRLGIEVYADRPRQQWRTRGNELQMVSDPLDLRGLAESGGTSPWAGMPAGTRMGHVHLSVGDLKVAEDFYHRALGFDKINWSYPGALFMSAGGYHHHVAVNTWASNARQATDGDARLLEWELILPHQADLDAVASSLNGAGYDAVDPWGVAVRLARTKNEERRTKNGTKNS